MKSHKLQITSIASYPARQDSHYPNGYDLRLDISCANQRECLLLKEFLTGADKIWVTDEEPVGSEEYWKKLVENSKKTYEKMGIIGYDSPKLIDAIRNKKNNE